MCYLKLIYVIFMIVQVTSFVDKGLSEPNSKIFGGTTFKITDAPYMALLFCSDNDFQCGACIVHQQFLVTAAHCIRPRSQYYIKVGTDNIHGGEKYEIEMIITHPKYTGIGIINYDLSVIKLKLKLSFNDRVRAVTLAPKNLVLENGTMMQSMGFGRTEMGSSSRTLLRVELPYVDIKTCSTLLNFNLMPSMVCAGGVAGKDTCTGDSGGPLVYKNMLVGVVSWGLGCGKGPGVYTRISHNRDFIDSTIKYYSWNWLWSWMRLWNKNK